MKIKTYLLFACVLLGLSTCKKDNKPEDIGIVKEKLINKITVKATEAGTPSIGKQEFSFSYNAANMITKVLQKVVDLPQGSYSSSDGQFDSYEYDGSGLLVKVNQHRRTNVSGPIELDKYFEYAYDATGQVSKVTSFSRRVGPPNGERIFRPNGYVSFLYNGAKQVIEQKSFNFILFDDDGKEVYSQTSVVRFEYDNLGNIRNTTRSYIENEKDVLSEKVEYLKYDTKKNPFYNKSVIIGAMLSFTTNKNLPLDIITTGFTNIPGLSNTTSENKFTVAYDGDYPVTMKADYIQRFYTTNGEGSNYTLQSREGSIETKFEYIDK